MDSNVTILSSDYVSFGAAPSRLRYDKVEARLVGAGVAPLVALKGIEMPLLSSPFSLLHSSIRTSDTHLRMGFFFPLIITSLLASLAATSPFQLEPDRLHLNLSSVSSGSYDSNQTALVDQNVTVSSSKNGNPIIVCDGQKYRHDLNLKSCEDAVSRVGSDRRNTIFGVRGGKMVDVGLPQRFISGTSLFLVAWAVSKRSG